MKINKITNAQEFFKVVDVCKGRVELLTGEWFRFLFITMRSKEAASGRFCRFKIIKASDHTNPELFCYLKLLFI